MEKNNIIIVSAPVQTGKTTTLQNWVAGRGDVAGFLTPDLNGKRMLLDVATQEVHPFQMESPLDETIPIGRFHFSKAAFDKGIQILEAAIHSAKKYIVLDEVGKLEILANKGFGPMLGKLLEKIKMLAQQKELVLVIRDSLLDEAIKKYGLQAASIIADAKYIERPMALSGLVLCGGNSTRMGTDKAFLHYHQAPQYQHIAQLLQRFCSNVNLSVNNAQVDKIAANYSLIIDDEKYADAGPMAGLLSAIAMHPNNALLLVGCDYPALTHQDLLQLVAASNNGKNLVCFKNEAHFNEPLLAIYPVHCFTALQQFYAAGNRSLRKFIEQVPHLPITPNSFETLQSFDTLEDFKNFRANG